MRKTDRQTDRVIEQEADRHIGRVCVCGGERGAPVFKRDRPSEKAGSVCVCVGLQRRGAGGWELAPARPGCPLAVPASICHQQEHLQPKVPLSPSVRVTTLAFPLVRGPCPSVRPSGGRDAPAGQKRGILGVKVPACVCLCVFCLRVSE